MESITAQEYRETNWKVVKKKHKYNAKRTLYNGRYYDSKAEAEHSKYLDTIKVQGEVQWILYQVPIPLGQDFSVRIDFVVYRWVRVRRLKWEPKKEVIAIDVKGYNTKRFKDVVRLWKKYGPFPLWIIHKGKLVETIEREA